MIKHFDHFVINSNNLRASMQFYEKLGFKGSEQDNHFHLRAHTFGIHVRPTNIQAALHANNPQAGSAFLTWEVDLNSDDLVSFLQDKDIAIEKGPVPHHGFYGLGMSTYVRDPDGNLIELISYHDIDES